MIDRIPPQNIEAEQSVIGAMLIDKEAIAKTSEVLRPEDFYRQDNRVIYEAILASLAILVWHWFFVIFRPSEYPMSFVWVDGKMSLHRYRHHHERHFKKIALEWMQVKEEQKNIDEVSHSTKLFLDTMKKHGANPDEIMSAEMENDPELRNWVIERLKGL